jgi:hypothetical protein
VYVVIIYTTLWPGLAVPAFGLSFLRFFVHVAAAAKFTIRISRVSVHFLLFCLSVHVSKLMSFCFPI